MFFLVKCHTSKGHVYDHKKFVKIAKKDKGKLLSREFVAEVIQSHYNKRNNKKTTLDMAVSKSKEQYAEDNENVFEYLLMCPVSLKFWVVSKII